MSEVKTLINWDSRKFIKSVGFFYKIAFAFLSLILFLFIHSSIPSNEILRNEITAVLFILIFILLIWPLQKNIIKRLFKNNYIEYILSGEHQQLDFLEKPLSIESLIRKDFPDFANWLHVDSYSLAILEGRKKYYKIYKYKNRKLFEELDIAKNELDKICSFLLKWNKELNVESDKFPKEVNNQLMKLKAKVVVPLFFRKTVIGLILFNNELKKNYEKNIYEIFCNKTSLTLQNHFLTQRILDIRVYDDEMKAAKEILKRMEHVSIPNIPNFKIEKHHFDKPYLFEYYKLSENKHLFQVIICETFKGTMGLLLYALVGQIFSFIQLIDNCKLTRLSKKLEESVNWETAKQDFSILFLELDTKENRIVLFSNQNKYIICPKVITKLPYFSKRNAILILPGLKLFRVQIENDLGVYYDSKIVFSIHKG